MPSGGWWDAGDYMKYVETISYTVALQEIGIRDFPNQMGAARSREPAGAAEFHFVCRKRIRRARFVQLRGRKRLRHRIPD